MADLESSIPYFTCTLGQAAAINDNHQINNAKTINDFLEVQARSQAELPAVGFPVLNGDSWSHGVFSFEDLHNGSLVIANELCCLIPKGKNDDSRCIALLCPSSIDFLFTWLALMKLGISVLLIAPQCQPAAISALCKSCNATLIFHDKSYEKLAISASSQSDSSLVAEVLPWQAQNKAITSVIRNSTFTYEFVALYQPSEHDVAYIHHSSGTSTGVPKPIPQTHRAGFGVLPHHLDGRQAATFTTTPLYHGGIADCFRSWTSNAMIWLFPGADLPITPKNILSCLNAASNAIGTPHVRYFSSVPYVLQMLAEEPDGLSALKSMDIVGVGGAALSPKVGDRLVNSGVNLVSRFGSAECGFLLSSHRDYASDKEWQYLRVPPSCIDTTLRFEVIDAAAGLAELVVKKGWPHMAKTNRADGSYATSDVFERHPTIANAWRYHSRSDGQITLLTGKKFDPAPLEEALCSSSELIRDVVIVGDGRQYPGALIFVHAGVTEQDLWEHLSKVNQEAESHSRINRNMISLVTGVESKPEKSSKGTILRGATEEKFSPEIERLYQQRTESPHAFVEDAQIIAVVKAIVQDVLGFEISDEEDFYQCGVDSIKSAQIKSKLQQRITGRRELPWNVVYDYGNLSHLSRFLVQFRKGEVEDREPDAQNILDLVERYSVFDPDSKVINYESTESHVVCLTGATGALGANILNGLLNEPSVSRVICFVRASDEHEAQTRISASLSSRKLPHLPSKSEKVKCIPLRLADSDLGLSQEMHDYILSEATHFIHAAWAVNFSLPLRSFIHEHISGLQKLLSLALFCRHLANFTFCSSTASVIRCRSSPIPETLSTSSEDADTLGYSKSKWVAEAICARAAKLKGMAGRLKIARVGQLTGDTENGIWNMSEAWPLMLSTVEELGCLPDIEQKLDWLSMDTAAGAVLDIVFRGKAEAMIYHVVNNGYGRSWQELLGWFKSVSKEGFEIVEPRVWLERLDGVKNHPAKKLLWLWQTGFGDDKIRSERTQNLHFSTQNATEVSAALRNFNGVDEKLARKIWLWLGNEMQRID